MIRSASVAIALAAIAATPAAQSSRQDPDLTVFFNAAAVDDKTAQKALDEIAASWRPGHAALLIDLARLIRQDPPVIVAVSSVVSVPAGSVPSLDAPPPPPDFVPQTPAGRARARLTAFLERQTGRRFGADLWAWREWLWKQPYAPHAEYASFKRLIYQRIDPRMAQFFPPGVAVRIRLDEVDWGGIAVNGIPPLNNPPTLAAANATYLKEDHIVFGIVVNGEARAYPKRILAWHELARDRVAGVDLTIVYCTLCGTVIPYISEVDGVRRTFGTSGLLYRSNKLMFDEESNSLWSSIEGTPVIGSLADRNLHLTRLPIVTTTWGEWRRTHPATRVLSLETGHKRNYGEGVAYKDYFSTDRLMFRVSQTDSRLRNKAEVLAMLVPGETGERQPVAVAADFLKKKPLYQFSAGGRAFVILTTEAGANRVYESRGLRFTAAGPSMLKDERARTWRQTEEALTSDDAGEPPLKRIAAHRAFWFGWYAQFPQTLLLK